MNLVNNNSNAVNSADKKILLSNILLKSLKNRDNEEKDKKLMYEQDEKLK